MHEGGDMRALLRSAVVLVVALGSPSLAAGQGQGDIDAINQLIDRYGALEDAMDMTGQAQLMAPDRVWIAQGGGRRTDQAANMRIQQAGFDQTKAVAPGIQTFTEDRDRVIKFYGNGSSVAVASFYRYTTVILPPDVPQAVAAAFQPVPPSVVTLVLEKRDGAWKIVHTHFSALGANGN
jgi:ketosteroid isomerase-like protein